MNVYDEIKQLELEKNSIKSKSMFDWDFFAEIDFLMEEIEIAFKDKIITKYQTEYTSVWNYEAKIKISDSKKWILKLINCKFNYKKNDIRFWYINLEILSDAKWQKTITHKLWKFPILEHEKIVEKLIEKLIEVIEEY